MKKILPEHHRMAGFTLIEVMVAVVIVAILAAIAYPSYTEQVRKANRTDAQGALLNLSQFMERYFTQNNRYLYQGTDNNLCQQAVTSICTSAPIVASTPPCYPRLTISRSPMDGDDVKYCLSVIGPGDGTPDANEYILVATPRTGSSQEGNGVLRLDNVGRKFWDINNDGDFADTDENQW